MPLIDMGQVKERVSFAAVLELLNWRHVRREAGWYRGGCPVHQRGREHGDCFAVREGGWKCHSCGRHGDQLRLWAEATGQAIYPATLDLCRRLGVEIPYKRPDPPRPRPGTREEAR
jgi:DNA primase